MLTLREHCHQNLITVSINLGNQCFTHGTIDNLQYALHYFLLPTWYGLWYFSLCRNKVIGRRLRSCMQTRGFLASTSPTSVWLCAYIRSWNESVEWELPLPHKCIFLSSSFVIVLLDSNVHLTCERVQLGITDNGLEHSCFFRTHGQLFLSWTKLL